MKNLISGLFLASVTLFMLSCKGKTADANMSESAVTEEAVTSQNTSKIYHVVPTASTLFWEGYRPAMGYQHNGTVTVSAGNLSVNENGKISGGSFVIDMQTITALDLEGDKKANLEAHLKGTSAGKEDDFFNITQYPTGKFEITKVTALEGDAEANMMVYGNLTLKDVTKSIGFKANVTVANGTLTATSPVFKIDRTAWNVKVLSNKFFDNLKEKFVDDMIGLRIELRADLGKDI